jgi:hypothetical protein
VTLIAAFRCYEGIVFCADSQETLGNPTPQGWENYRCTVDKIEPQFDGQYHWVAGGAGDADLVDGFTDRLKDEISQWREKYEVATLKQKLREIVLDYNQNEAARMWDGGDALDFLIALRHADAGSDPVLFKTGRSVRTIRDFALIGWDQGIYKHFMRRLYKDREGQKRTRHFNSANRALLVGAYLMMLGRQTSNNIGPPTVVVKVFNNFVREESPETLTNIEGKLEAFSRILEDVTLHCSDADLANHLFPAYLDNIERQLMNLREQYFGPTRGGYVHLFQPNLQEPEEKK